MKPCVILTIPHAEQRYPTVGDYQEDHGLIVISVSKTEDWRYDALVAVHELVEKLCCMAHGVTDAQVDDFDLAFVEHGCEVCGNRDEPGADHHAPYHQEHIVAERVERIVAVAMGVNWHDYEDALGRLCVT